MGPGRAVQAVNSQLIDLYWQVGGYISRKLEQAEWGDSVVSQLATHLAKTQPGLRGFTRRNLFRMRQFYETYRGDEKVSALLSQLPWTHNLIIFIQSKLPQEREFWPSCMSSTPWGLLLMTALEPGSNHCAPRAAGLQEWMPGAAALCR